MNTQVGQATPLIGDVLINEGLLHPDRAAERPDRWAPWWPPQVGLPADALDDRIAIVGTAGSGKTYAAKGFVERLLKGMIHPGELGGRSPWLGNLV
jgi:hypothetical protein